MTTALIIAAVILASAAAAMAMRNVIHCALALVVTWLGVAIFYLWAGAEFAAFAQVLVYVGAISMVVLFAVLLTRPSGDQTTPGGKPARTSAPHYVVSAVLVGIAVGAVLTLAIQTTPLAERKTAEAPALSVKEIGEQLAGPHAAALLAIGVLLTVALIGSVAIAATLPRRKEP